MFDLLKRPLVTEKNTERAATLNEYVLEVSLDANRIQIKKAVEKFFSVEVLRVNTQVCRKETRKLGKYPGKRRLWKKAVVKLKEGQKLDFISG
jgi:large subunit ribosomal protein L23